MTRKARDATAIHDGDAALRWLRIRPHLIVMRNRNALLSASVVAFGMERALNVQTVGSMIVIVTFIAAEAATMLLSAHPGSAVAWYVNLGVFGVFERARSEPSPLRFLFGPDSLMVATSCLLLLAAARLARLRLVIAITANLSFCFAVALAFASLDRPTEQATASLFSMAFRPDSAPVTFVMLLASFGAALMSHAAYIVTITMRKTPVES